MQCTLVGIARLLECYSYCRSSLPCSSSAYFYLDGIETNSKFSLTVWYNEHPENRVSFCQAPEILDKSILLSLTKLAYSSARPSGVGGGGVWRGVLRISSDRDDRRILGGSKFSSSEIFWGGKFWQVFFLGCLI